MVGEVGCAGVVAAACRQSIAEAGLHVLSTSAPRDGGKVRAAEAMLIGRK